MRLFLYSRIPSFMITCPLVEHSLKPRLTDGLIDPFFVDEYLEFLLFRLFLYEYDR